MKMCVKFAISLLLIQTLSSSPAMSATWYEIEKELCNQIEVQGLSKTLKQYSRPNNLKSDDECIKAVAVSTRAGNKELAREALFSLRKKYAKDDSNKISDLCDFLIKSNSWDLSQVLMENFPSANPGYGYILVNHMLETKSFSVVDDWLKKYPRADQHHTIMLRIAAAQKSNQKSRLITELTQDLKSHPSLLSLRAYILGYDALSERGNLDWIKDFYKPKTAYEAWQAGETISSNHEYCAAEYYQRAIAMPWTSADQEAMDKFLRTHSARFIERNESWEKDLRTAAKQSLATCYQRMGASQKAQKLLLELEKESPGRLPVFALSQFAGAVQQSTPQKPLENKIKQAEEPNKNDPQYWLGRAAYYKGRKEKSQELDALNHAMATTQLPTKSSSPTDIFTRTQAVRALAYYWHENSQESKSLQFLWHEFDSSKSLEYRENIVQQVSDLNTSWLQSNETHLWNYLKESKKWQFRQERVLYKMAENCAAAEREKFWNSTELLAKNEASRSLVAAWVMTRTNADLRAIPLLDFARKHLPDKESIVRANFTLFEAYLNLNKWREAEAVYPEAKKELQAQEQPDWLSKIALSAARSGADADALRIWKKKDNLDRTYISPLQELKKYSRVKSLLKSYYQNLSKTEPASAEMFNQAIKILDSPN